MSFRNFILRVIFPLYNLMTGRNIPRYLAEMEKTQWLSPEAIEALQWKRLKKLLNFAGREVPFYREKFEHYQIDPEQINTSDDFRRIPFLEKDDIIQNTERLLASNVNRKKLLCASTGGSTGRSITFYRGPHEFASFVAARARGDKWAGLDLGEKAAWLWGMEEPSIQFKLENLLFNYRWMSAFNLNETAMERYVRELNRFCPKLIFGYSSALYFFARFIESHSLGICSPKAIISSAEVLYEHQRETIEKVFDCKVFNRYGCREIGLISMECEHGNYHLNADNLYIEILRDNNPARNGEAGEIVITDLRNYTMPFIRYRIEDTANPLWGVNCPCGRGLPLIGSITGRTSDIFISPTGKILHGEYFTHLFYGVDEIKQFQLIQKQKEQIILKIVPGEGYNQAVLTPIIEKIKAVMGANIDVQVEVVEQIPLTKAGKYRFTISEVPLEF